MTFDWQRTLQEGEQLARDQIRRGDPVNDRAIMWALLCEAARVSAICYPSPPHSGLPGRSAMPDSGDDVSQWHMISAYLRNEIDQMPDVQSRAPRPNASAITRADHVLEVWHKGALTHMGDKSRVKRALYMKANGMKNKLVLSVTGLSHERLKNAKRDAMDDMANFIRIRESGRKT